MKLSEFNYTIHDDHIAQHPLKERDSSKLLVIHRSSGALEHRTFRDIIDYLQPGDVLVLNNTKVFPARLRGKKPTGGKAEITLLNEIGLNKWEGLVKGVHEGTIILEHGITADISRISGTMAKIEFRLKSGSDIKEFLEEIGVMPLPGYIKRDSVSADSRQYQTVYAEKEGAIAAPTAGLHFTDTLMEKLSEKGIEIQTVTLHVGYGTFKSITADVVTDHQMDTELYEIPAAAARTINSAKADGRRVIAVGTTVTRTLESSAQITSSRSVQSGPGEASMFIYPGYEFKIVDSLVTNFHLPKSTPMMLASAFSNLDLLKKAYHEAQKENYRFYSYGDAMILL